MRHVSMLHVTAALLIGKLYHGKQNRRTWVLDYYLQLRNLNIPGSTKITDVFDQLPEKLQTLTANVILKTHAHKLGFLGNHTTNQSLNNVQDNTPVPYTKIICKKTLKQQAKLYAKQHNLTCYTTNTNLKSLISLLKNTLDENAANIPYLAWKPNKVAYHLNIMKEAFLFAEVQIPQNLLEDIRQAYLKFKDIFPISILYSLCYYKTAGIDLTPSPHKIALLLGYKGYLDHKYNYFNRYIQYYNKIIFPSYNITYLPIATIQNSFDKKGLKLFLEKKNPTELYYQVEPHELNNYKYPFRRNYILNEKNQKKWVTGIHTHALFTEQKDHHKEYEYKDLLFSFPNHVKFLELRSLHDTTLRMSAFTQVHHQLRAFHKYVKENPLTKPNQNRLPTPEDKRWLPIFNEYLNSDFTPKTLIPILKKDEVFFTKIKVDIKRHLEGYKYENTPKLEEESKLFYEEILLPEWELFYGNPRKKFGPIRVRKQKTGNKIRTLCSTSAEQKLLEKVSNRVLQIILQKLNRDMFDYSISNYLPGTSVPLYSMERIREALTTGTTICNMDVKSCFDNLKLTSPGYTPRIEEAIKEVEREVSGGAAEFTRRTLLEYLKGAVDEDRYEYKGERPDRGTLPTGFVLSPMAWLFVTIPTLKRMRGTTIKAWDLCGDDFMAVTEGRDPGVTKPWMELAEDLGLEFHFFKNYRENVEGSEEIGERREQEEENAWAENFPTRRLQVYHGGAAIHRGREVHAVTSVRDKESEKLTQALAKIKRQRGANFVAENLLDRKDPNLVNLQPSNWSPTKGEGRDRGKQELKDITRGRRLCMARRFTRELWKRTFETGQGRTEARSTLVVGARVMGSGGGEGRWSRRRPPAEYL